MKMFNSIMESVADFLKIPDDELGHVNLEDILRNADKIVREKNYKKVVSQINPSKKPLKNIKLGVTFKDEAQGIIDGIDEAFKIALHKIDRDETLTPNQKKYQKQKKKNELMKKYTSQKENSWLDVVARTHITRAMNAGRAQAAKDILAENPKMKIWKMWNHRGSDDIGYNPRPNHARMHGKKHLLNTMFSLPTKDGIIKCDRPHSEQLPVGEIVNCRCTLDYLVEG